MKTRHTKIIVILTTLLATVLLSGCAPLTALFKKSDILSHKTYKKVPKPESVEEEHQPDKMPHKHDEEAEKIPN